MQRSKRRTAIFAGLTTLALVAAACGGDDDGGESTEVDVTTGDTGGDTATTTGDTGGDTATTTGDTGGDTGGDTDTTEGEAAPGESHVGDEGEPVQGGDLVYGIEADSANPWAPYRTSTATAGYVMMTSVADPLFTAYDDGEIAPMLVESWEANDDFTVWTFQVREGVLFHDGTPMDGAAVAFNIETCMGSPLTGAALTIIESVEGEGQTVTLNLREPDVVIPRAFTERQCAYMFSPDWLRTLPDLPQRTEGNPFFDAELAATPADGDPTQPVGSGAYVFESYTPGNGNSFRLVRNEDYWRGPDGVTGESLPYLDSIEGVVAVDIDSRTNGLRSGEFDLIHTSNVDSLSEFIGDDEFEVTSSSRFGDTNYIMLNTAQGEADPDGVNADSPLLNVNCRRALAQATDQQRLIDERYAGIAEIANGPFTPDMLGYTDDTGYPTFDPDAALESFETCLTELGTDSIEFTFNTTNDPFNVETNTLMISMWTDVFGDRIAASIEPIEQGQYIGLALVGTFNAFAWRNHGGIDPDTQNYWWNSASAAPIGELALNFGRFQDPDMDAALAELRSNPDEAARQEAAEEVNRIFGEQVYNIWTSWAIWGVISSPYVNGVEMNAIPGDDAPGLGLAFSGRHQMNQLWCNEGVCE